MKREAEKTVNRLLKRSIALCVVLCAKLSNLPLFYIHHNMQTHYDYRLIIILAL